MAVAAVEVPYREARMEVVEDRPSEVEEEEVVAGGHQASSSAVEEEVLPRSSLVAAVASLIDHHRTPRYWHHLVRPVLRS